MNQLPRTAILVAIVLSGAAAQLTGSLHAHPGRTAADGCHYCRTNCDQCGEAWNARHCHGGSAPAGSATPAPSAAKPSVPTVSTGRTSEATSSTAVAGATATGTVEQGSTATRTIPAPADGAPVQLAQVAATPAADDGFGAGLVAGLLVALLGIGGWKVLRRGKSGDS